MMSPRTASTSFHHASITLVSVTIATFCAWLMWVVAYMAQLNPIITPEYEGEH